MTVPSDILSALDRHAVQTPDKTAFTFLRDGEEDEVSLSFSQLAQSSKRLAGVLQTKAQAGDRVLLAFPTGLEYVKYFLACLYAGMVAVPVYPPNLIRAEQSLKRIRNIASSAQPTLVLTTDKFLEPTRAYFKQSMEFERIGWLTPDDEKTGSPASFTPVPVRPESLAFLQYTSGSTGTPKGVMVSHGNLNHNQLMLRELLSNDNSRPFVSWLPLYHDMGLVGKIVCPLFMGSHSILMKSQAFVEKPFRWLKAISHYRASTSYAPNFAYDLCVNRITENNIKQLDLSCWDVAVNGADVVRLQTIERFYNSFEACGFKKQSFFPSYGMAEGTLIISTIGQNSSPSESFPEQKDWATGNHTFAPYGMVSCGKTCQGQTIKIVDPQKRTLVQTGEIGEIWVSGKSVASGYWNMPDKTQKTFQACIEGEDDTPFLRTGDLGFIKDDELFIAGRIKDTIVIRGQNYYPQDIEDTVSSAHPLIRPGYCIAFGVLHDNEEKFIILGEVRRKKGITDAEAEDIVQSIKSTVAERHGLSAHAIVLIKPKTIFKTSSGKLRRFACKQAFLDDTLACLHRSDAAADVQASSQSALLVALKHAASPEAKEALTSVYLQEQASQLLKVAATQVSTEKPLYLLGFDSLLFFQLKIIAETNLGVELASSDRFLEMSIADLSALATQAQKKA